MKTRGPRYGQITASTKNIHTDSHQQITQQSSFIAFTRALQYNGAATRGDISHIVMRYDSLYAAMIDRVGCVASEKARATRGGGATCVEGAQEPTWGARMAAACHYKGPSGHTSGTILWMTTPSGASKAGINTKKTSRPSRDVTWTPRLSRGTPSGGVGLGAGPTPPLRR